MGNPPDQSIPVCVSFKIFDNADLLGDPLDAGDAFTTYDVDWTLKVEANNLWPDSHYWFQFTDCAKPQIASPIGMTRTIASPDSMFPHLKIVAPSLTVIPSSCRGSQRGQATYACGL